MQLRLKKLFVRQLSLILGNKGRRQRPAQGIFDNFIIFVAQSSTPIDGRSCAFSNVAVQSF